MPGVAAAREAEGHEHFRARRRGRPVQLQVLVRGPARAGTPAFRVPPAAITVAGVLAGAGAGLALALLRPGILGGVAVAVLLAARLACANLDGGVARDGDRATPFGAVLNEAGDRGAELCALAGCLALAPSALVAAAALAATLPSWVSLAGASAGLGRSRSGEIGEFHRGAARLARAAGVPLVPAGISGARTLLPPGGTAGRPRRGAVTVRFGAPVMVRPDAADATAEARVRVEALVAGGRGLSGRHELRVS